MSRSARTSRTSPSPPEQPSPDWDLDRESAKGSRGRRRATLLPTDAESGGAAGPAPTEQSAPADTPDKEEHDALAEVLALDALYTMSVADQLRALRTRLGVETPPTYTTITVPVERLVVPSEPALQRQGKAYSVNIGVMGVLHPPAILAIPGTDQYRVVTGRRRVIGARRLEQAPPIECHLYARLSQVEQWLLILSENGRRAPVWAQEVEALAALIEERAGMTEREIALFLGLSIATVRQRLKFAQLPPAILAQVIAGSMPQAVARRITHLSSTERAALEERAQDGEEITTDLVALALRGQVSAGMTPIRQAFASADASWSPWGVSTTWADAVTEAASAAVHSAAHGDAEQTTERTAPPEDPPKRAVDLLKQPSLRATIADLRHLEQGLRDEPGAARALVLTQALAQELVIMQRTRGATAKTAKI